MKKANLYQETRDYLTIWQEELKTGLLHKDSNLAHTFNLYFKDKAFLGKLNNFANAVGYFLEPLVQENNLDSNLPSLQSFNALGEPTNTVIHHPSYVKAGDIIYGSQLMQYLLTPGQMLKTLSLFLLSSHAGEAGHNCPIACSAGLMRVLKNHSKLAETEIFLNKFTENSFTTNYTGAQFLTEIQGGSDVGANATYAFQNKGGQWHIKGEKWFCSNANADLILLTARTDDNIKGTKGLGLFLVPAKLGNGEDNHFRIKRLKQKLGTRSMATAEIDFIDALAYPMGELDEGIHLALGNVLHISRIFNAFSVLGMARRAHQIAKTYATHRLAFGTAIINFPLVKEHLALIHAENITMLAGAFHMVVEQDELDLEEKPRKEQTLLMRTIANINKYFTAKRSVENVHHCIDILAGNGIVETFSSLPRLLRDSLICENWEGTHFTLWMQTLRDIEKFKIDDLFSTHLLKLYNQLKKQFAEKAILLKEIENLKIDFELLKKQSPELQSLAIEAVIKKMAILYSALSLALELETLPSESKQKALSLFILVHIVKTYKKDEVYLNLINQI